MLERGEPEALIRAQIFAFQRKFKEATAVYRSAGYEQKAMEMFTELRMFDEAQVIALPMDIRNLSSGVDDFRIGRNPADANAKTSRLGQGLQ